MWTGFWPKWYFTNLWEPSLSQTPLVHNFNTHLIYCSDLKCPKHSKKTVKAFNNSVQSRGSYFIKVGQAGLLLTFDQIFQQIQTLNGPFLRIWGLSGKFWFLVLSLSIAHIKSSGVCHLVLFGWNLFPWYFIPNGLKFEFEMRFWLTLSLFGQRNTKRFLFSSYSTSFDVRSTVVRKDLYLKSLVMAARYAKNTPNYCKTVIILVNIQRNAQL